ncbi:MAG: response regulator [Deltaproteobacteria bacterium]|nr:response regulator [Deltaproteobacteria bacterium]
MEADRTRTLVVTLDPALIQQIRTALEERGGIVSACPTGDGALDEITQRTYGLVVVSAELPDQDGFELVGMLKALDPQIRVLLVGDDRDGRSIVKAVEAGAEGFLHRPVRAAELLARFQDAMGSTWFNLDPESAKSIVRNADSIVDPRTSIFGADTGFDLSVQEGDDVGVVGDSDPDDDSADLAASSFSDEVSSASESNGDEPLPEPVQRAVGGKVGPGPSTGATQELPSLAIEEFDENHPVSVPVGSEITAHGVAPVAAVLGPQTGEYGTLKPAEAIERRIDKMLEPGGKLSQAIEDAVGNAVANALAEQLPAVLAALKGDSE